MSIGVGRDDAISLGSSYGLRAMLYGFNSKISVIDEMQDEFNKLSNKGASPYLQMILTDMKILSNGTDNLSATTTKDKTYPEIKYPRYFTILGRSIFASQIS